MWRMWSQLLNLEFSCTPWGIFFSCCFQDFLFGVDFQDFYYHVYARTPLRFRMYSLSVFFFFSFSLSLLNQLSFQSLLLVFISPPFFPLFVLPLQCFDLLNSVPHIFKCQSFYSFFSLSSSDCIISLDLYLLVDLLPVQIYYWLPQPSFLKFNCCAVFSSGMSIWFFSYKVFSIWIFCICWDIVIIPSFYCLL